MADDDHDMIMHNAFWQRARECDYADDHVVMEPDARYHLTQALGVLMSDASEELWSMQWGSDQQDTMPPMLLSGEPTGLTQAQVDLMRAIAKGLGHWANREDYERGEQYVPYQPKCLRTKGQNP